MNGLGEVQVYLKSFICEKENVQKQIADIEQKRTQLAEQRNEKKKLNNQDAQVNELGKQISELGNKSQELQNKLDSNLSAFKAQINLIIDNLVAEGIRKIRKIDEEIQEIENKIENFKERNEKYQLQKQEFYLRFGRMPELSESAKNENKLQEKEIQKNQVEIKDFELKIELIQEEISECAKAKTEFKRGNWEYIINAGEKICIDNLQVEEMEPIEEFFVEAFEPIEELKIEEIHVEEFELDEEKSAEETETIIENADEEIEKLARAIVEQIAEEQAKPLHIEETEKVAEDIIAFEEKDDKKVIIPLFGQKPTISNITIKIEDGELVYKAQMSDDNEVKIYPAQIGKENVLLRDKQNRKECEEILVNYAISEYKMFDKKVINKIDPLVCELLIECAEKYAYDAQELIYNYAMSFSYVAETDVVPDITYNLSFIENSKLTRKEKAIISRISKNARKNNKIEIIETMTKFKKFKYILKRLFAINNVKVLPQAKY